MIIVIGGKEQLEGMEKMEGSCKHKNEKLTPVTCILHEFSGLYLQALCPA